MFLNNLSINQRKVFLGLANRILIIDNSVDAAEIMYLRRICAEMSLSLKDGEEFPIETLDEVFPKEEERRLVIIELMALAQSNEEFHEYEKDFIIKVINAFGIDNSVIDEIELLVKEYFATQKKLANFIAENK
jgi:uncharacterized tellurite resistance protein B-like protein